MGWRLSVELISRLFSVDFGPRPNATLALSTCAMPMGRSLTPPPPPPKHPHSRDLIYCFRPTFEARWCRAGLHYKRSTQIHVRIGRNSRWGQGAKIRQTNTDRAGVFHPTPQRAPVLASRVESIQHSRLGAGASGPQDSRQCGQLNGSQLNNVRYQNTDLLRLKCCTLNEPKSGANGSLP